MFTIGGSPALSSNQASQQNVGTEPGDDTEDAFDAFIINYESIFEDEGIQYPDQTVHIAEEAQVVEPVSKRARLSQDQQGSDDFFSSSHSSSYQYPIYQNLGAVSCVGSVSMPFLTLPIPAPNTTHSNMPLFTHGNYHAMEEPSTEGESNESGESSDDDGEEIVPETTLHHQESLLGAAENGELEMIRKLLHKSPNIDINYRDRGDQGTALLWACKSGQFEVAKLLLSEGGDPNVANIYGWTALIYAARYGQCRLLLLLLESDSEVDAITCDGRTALIWAATNGDLEVVKALLAFGANIDHADNEGFTALLYAIRRGHTRVAQYLMEKGANVWATTPLLKTSLHLAAEQGNSVILFNLLNRGFEIDVEDVDGWTPLLEAALCGRTNAIAFLLAHGASPNAIDKLRNQRNVNICTLRMNLGSSGEDEFIW